MVIKILLSKEMNFNIVQLYVSECSKCQLPTQFWLIHCNMQYLPTCTFWNRLFSYCGRMFNKTFFFIIWSNNNQWYSDSYFCSIWHVCMKNVTYNYGKGVGHACENCIKKKWKLNAIVLYFISLIHWVIITRVHRLYDVLVKSIECNW